MGAQGSSPPASSTPVQRQVVLPLSKAVEIAYKSIRLRLSRSLLVTSGIVLALAFLTSILSSEAIVRAMQQWATATAHSTDAPRAQTEAAQRLLAEMKSNGVPATPQEIRSDHLRTRWVAGLALLVALVGILNAMLMSVTERFREIGTMKCLGAMDRFIIELFLLESLFQGTAGTLAGIALGLLLSLAAARARYGSIVWRSFPVSQIAAICGVCLLVGIALTVAGAVYPAWQAARMQPVEAMRADA